MNHYIGCSGWSYLGWKGTFYPNDIENKDYLSYYSKFIKFVEVDSTYYNIPSRFVVKAWNNKTPSDFRFTLKFPKIITHEKKLEDISKPMSLFLSAIEPLIDKTLMLLIQLPPYLTEKKGFDHLMKMVTKLDNRFRYALEVREASWFNENVYKFLKENNISLVWSIRDELKTPPIITTDQIYVRFIGDRSINENDFGKIVKDRTKEMIEYAKRFKELINDDGYDNSKVRDILIAFNNHFAGFGPQSVNDFLKILKEPEVNWKDELEKVNRNNTNLTIGSSQSNLTDFH